MPHDDTVQMVEQVGVPLAANLTSRDPGIDLQFSMNRAGQIEGRYALQNFDSPGQMVLDDVRFMEIAFRQSAYPANHGSFKWDLDSGESVEFG